MGLFDALSDLAYEIKMDRIISRADREQAKWDKEIAKKRAAAKAENDARNEVLWRDIDKILQDSTMNDKEEVPFHPEYYRDSADKRGYLGVPASKDDCKKGALCAVSG